MKRALEWLPRLVTPPWVAIAYLLGLAAIAARRQRADKAVMGVDAGNVAALIERAFPDHVARGARMVVLLSVVEGALIGVSVVAVLRLRRAARLERGSPWGELALSLVLVPVVHALAVLVAAAVRPALLAAALYDAGGARRLVQIVASDVLGAGGVLALAAAIALVVALGAPRRWAHRAGNLAYLARRRGGTIAALVALLAITGGAWRIVAAPPRHPAHTRPNVLVLSVDSLRKDRLVERTAPTLTAFAKRSWVFEQAYVTIPRTFPSWVTALTGRDPHHHGVRSMFPSRAQRERDFAALPARLTKEGFATFVASDFAGDIFPRIELGFQTVAAPTFHFGELVRQRIVEGHPALAPLVASPLGRALLPPLRGLARVSDSRGVTDDTLRLVDAARDRPFFGVAFYGAAHFPYAAPAPYHARFADRAYRGRYRYEKKNVLGREAPPDPADKAQIRALYDGAVRSVDDEIGRLLAGLSARGLLASTRIVVTADHGEALYDDERGQGHGDDLYGRDVLEVPLVVWDGTGKPGRVEQVTRDVDLVPSLLDLLGLEPAERVDGRSWAKALSGAPLEPRLAFSETGLWFTEEVEGVPRALRIPYPDVSRMLEVDRAHGDDVVLQARYFPITTLAKHRAVSSTTHRLVLAPTRLGLRRQLFDLRTDPRCEQDLYAPDEPTAQALEKELFRWVLEDRELAYDGRNLTHRGSTRDQAADARVRVEGAR